MKGICMIASGFWALIGVGLYLDYIYNVCPSEKYSKKQTLLATIVMAVHGYHSFIRSIFRK